MIVDLQLFFMLGRAGDEETRACLHPGWNGSHRRVLRCEGVVFVSNIQYEAWNGWEESPLQDIGET